MTATSAPLAPPSSARPAAYDSVQRGFHWGMAAIILAAVALGLWASTLEPGTPLRRGLLEWHKSLGITAFWLALARILWRAGRRAPAYIPPLGRLTHAAAGGAHLALYALMLFMPLSGYLFSGAGGYSLPGFGLFQWPRLVPLDKALAARGEALHVAGAYVIYAVLALHVGAVAWHQWVLRDGVLARMWPRRGAAPTA